MVRVYYEIYKRGVLNVPDLATGEATVDQMLKDHGAEILVHPRIYDPQAMYHSLLNGRYIDFLKHEVSIGRALDPDEQALLDKSEAPPTGFAKA